MTDPIIGITAWKRALDTFLGEERLHTLSDYYVQATIGAGLIPLIIPNGQDPGLVDAIVSSVDGLLLSGGDDVDPAGYGEENTASNREDPAVDHFEAALVAEARRRAKPVLAICRGIQLLNVALGGTLNQEVTKEGTVHEPIPERPDPAELIARRHVVHFEEGSLLQDLYGARELKVNTLHHQGIARLAPGLVVEGRAEDGLIEAARCEGDWWALGVQWHPERLDTDHHRPLLQALRAVIERG